MRAYVLLGRVRGENAWEMVFGPETPVTDQRAEFKEARGSRVHPRYERLELWERGGPVEGLDLDAPGGAEGGNSAPLLVPGVEINPNAPRPPGVFPQQELQQPPANAPAPAPPAAPAVEPPSLVGATAPADEIEKPGSALTDDPAEEFAAGKAKGGKAGRK